MRAARRAANEGAARALEIAGAIREKAARADICWRRKGKEGKMGKWADFLAVELALSGALPLA